MDNNSEIELELEQDVIDYLTSRASKEGKTFDQVVEDILRIEIERLENEND